MAETTVVNKNTAPRNTGNTGYVANGGAAHGYQRTPAGVPRPNNLPMVRTGPQTGGSAQIGGSLPKVDVKMTNNGPEVQNPHQAQPMRGQPNRHPSQQSGGLKMVQVKMGSRGPEVLSGGPEFTPKQPWSQATAHQYQHAFADQNLEQPELMPEMPEAPPFTDDQILLCRFLLDGFITGAGDTVPPEQIQLAESTIVAIDDTMNARNAAEALASIAATEPQVAQVRQAPAQPRPAMPRQLPPRAVIATRGTVQLKGVAPRSVPRRVPAPQAVVPQASVTVIDAPVAAQAPTPTRAPVVIDVPDDGIADAGHQ